MVGAVWFCSWSYHKVEDTSLAEAKIKAEATEADEIAIAWQLQDQCKIFQEEIEILRQEIECLNEED